MLEATVLAEYLDGKVQIKVGDITHEHTDAIVNAANHTLFGGGGVDGAIHRAGGPTILEECKQVREREFPKGLPDGEATTTHAGKLSAWIIIHTVGPVWKGGDNGEEIKLRNCYENSLREAERSGCLSIAFPAISTGVYHYPKEAAARVTSQTIKDYFEEKNLLAEVNLIFFSEEDARLFMENQVF
jgi:O-acetyl-ADP-ribose deacetylase (regulator of RNase III)